MNASAVASGMDSTSSHSAYRTEVKTGRECFADTECGRGQREKIRQIQGTETKTETGCRGTGQKHGAETWGRDKIYIRVRTSHLFHRREVRMGSEQQQISLFE